MRRRISTIGFVLATGVLAVSMAAASRSANAQIGIGVSITLAPPALPVYEQPPLPAAGYIWIPGYWAWGIDGYFWVPGYWEMPPTVGLLWTPGYWGCNDAGIYAWHEGYWGPHIGFYGGVNYGFGYTGVGYAGGHWNGGVFAYNRAVNNFGGAHVTNVYNQTVVVNNNVTNVSYNGGSGGMTARPTAQEQAVAHEQHVAPTTTQTQHQQTASSNKALLASQNNGKPAIAAVAKPNQFSGPGVVAAHEATPASAAPGAKPGAGGPVGANPNAKLEMNPHALKTNSSNINVPSAVNPNALKIQGKAQGTTQGATQGTNTLRPHALGTSTPPTNTLEKKGAGGNPAALNHTGTHTGTPPNTSNTQSGTLGNNSLPNGHTLPSGNTLSKPVMPTTPLAHSVSSPTSPTPHPPGPPHAPGPPQPHFAAQPHPAGPPHPPAAPHPAGGPAHPNGNGKKQDGNG